MKLKNINIIYASTDCSVRFHKEYGKKILKSNEYHGVIRHLKYHFVSQN